MVSIIEMYGCNLDVTTLLSKGQRHYESSTLDPAGESLASMRCAYVMSTAASLNFVRLKGKYIVHGECTAP